jgi:4'-phosphopantetheinyl transferase
LRIRTQALPWPLSAADRSLLEPSELARAAALRAVPDREACLASRILLRRTLSEFSRRAPATWRFAVNAHGRPELAPGQHEPPIRFSLSRCQSLVACAVVQHFDLGIDVMHVDEPVDRGAIAGSFFAASEREQMERLPESQRRECFASLWTLKEAYAKARGLGLSLDLQSFAFALGDGGISPILVTAPDDRSADWQLAVLRPTFRHVLAVAVRRGEPPDLRLTLAGAGQGPGHPTNLLLP